jgi:hypothetical protein
VLAGDIISDAEPGGWNERRPIVRAGGDGIRSRGEQSVEGIARAGHERADRNCCIGSQQRTGAWVLRLAVGSAARRRRGATWLVEERRTGQGPFVGEEVHALPQIVVLRRLMDKAHADVQREAGIDPPVILDEKLHVVEHVVAFNVL